MRSDMPGISGSFLSCFSRFVLKIFIEKVLDCESGKILGSSLLLSPFSVEELGGWETEAFASRFGRTDSGYWKRDHPKQEACDSQLHPEECQNPQCLCWQVHLLRVPQPCQYYWTDVSNGCLLQRTLHHLRIRNTDNIQRRR